MSLIPCVCCVGVLGEEEGGDRRGRERGGKKRSNGMMLRVMS